MPYYNVDERQFLLFTTQIKSNVVNSESGLGGRGNRGIREGLHAALLGVGG